MDNPFIEPEKLTPLTELNSKNNFNHLLADLKEAVLLKDWKGLERISNRLIKIDNSKIVGFKWLARSSLALNKLDKATWAYKRCLDIQSDFNEAIEHIRTLDFQKPKKAIQTDPIKLIPKNEKIASHLDPKDVENLALREKEMGQLYLEHKLYKRAVSCFEQSIHWDSKNYNTLYFLAYTQTKAKNENDAINTLKKALAQTPKWIEGRLLLGEIYAHLGYHAEAQKEWQIVLGLDPKNEKALKNLTQLVSP